MTSRLRTTEPVDPARSALMSRVGQRNTKPELVVRRLLRELGVYYRLHVRKLPGSPDICIPSLKRIVFVHGCFWHRHPDCRYSSTPKTRRSFWNEKFTRNIERDADNTRALKREGWKVTLVWECECRDESKLMRRLRRVVSAK